VFYPFFSLLIEHALEKNKPEGINCSIEGEKGK
jgi:hypothetical protein